MRDPETISSAITIAETGHLVFSTLHTNDAATAIPRLIDLGGEPFLISSVFNLSVAQRIIRRICDTCKEWFEPPMEVQTSIRTHLGNFLPKSVQDSPTIKIAKGKGCEECNHSGYLGRVAIFEVLKLSPAVNKMILNQSNAKDIEEFAKTEGFMAMQQEGYLKVLEGITTLEEVMRVTEM